MMQRALLAGHARTQDCINPAAQGLCLPAVLLSFLLLQAGQVPGSVHEHQPRLQQLLHPQLPLRPALLQAMQHLLCLDEHALLLCCGLCCWWRCAIWLLGMLGGALMGCACCQRPCCDQVASWG
jgi:hypothetical protein